MGDLNIRVQTYNIGGAGLLVVSDVGLRLRAAQGTLTVTFEDSAPVTPRTMSAPKGELTQPFFVDGALPGIYRFDVTIQANPSTKKRSHYIIVPPSQLPDPDLPKPGDIITMDVCVNPSRPDECDI